MQSLTDIIINFLVANFLSQLVDTMLKATMNIDSGNLIPGDFLKVTEWKRNEWKWITPCITQYPITYLNCEISTTVYKQLSNS